MKTRTCVSVIAALVGLLAAVGQLPAQTTTATAETKVSFEVVKTPLVIAVSGPDPFLQEAKYAACFRTTALVLRGVDSLPIEVAMRQPETGSLPTLLRMMVQRTPAKELSQEERDLLSTQVGRAIRFECLPTTPGAPPAEPREGMPPTPPVPPYAEEGPEVMGPQGQAMGPGLWEVQILAPSPEKAEQWVRALIRAYNTGWAESGRAEAQRALKLQRAELEQMLPNVQALQAKLKEAQESLERFPDIDTDAQAALRTKKWLLAVDIAGIQARADRIKELMAPKDAVGIAVPELVSLQIAASVDLADLGARLKTTDMLLEQAAERAKLQPEFDRREEELRPFQWRKDQLEAVIKYNEQLLSGPALAPLSVEGGKVTIRPITWKIQPNVPQPGGPMGPPFRPGE